MTVSGRHITVAAGGTGGHMAPADAVKDVLLARGHSVSLVTDKRGAAISNMLQDVPRHILTAESHQRGGMVGRVRAGMSLIQSYREVKRTFKASPPDLVIGFGGYPSLPAVRAAKARSIPFLLHEQNAILGRVNRWSAKAAAEVLLSVAETERIPPRTRTYFTGNPVRSPIRQAAEASGEAGPVSASKAITVLILGGSQGARILSDLVPQALVALAQTTSRALKVYQQARPEDLNRVEEVYRPSGIEAVIAPYFEDVASLLQEADVAICRAGASTIAELHAFACPAVLIPLKIAADDHQRANAEAFASFGGVQILREEGATDERLGALLKPWIDRPADLSAARANLRVSRRLDAAEHIADRVEAHLNSGESTP